MGGATANAFANLKIENGEKESALLPLCIGIFAFGCVLFGLGVMNSIKVIERPLNKGLQSIINFCEKN